MNIQDPRTRTAGAGEVVPLAELAGCDSVGGNLAKLERIKVAHQCGTAHQLPPIAVVRFQDGGMYLLDGHNRLRAAREANVESIRVVWIDDSQPKSRERIIEVIDEHVRQHGAALADAAAELSRLGSEADFATTIPVANALRTSNPYEAQRLLAQARR